MKLATLLAALVLAAPASFAATTKAAAVAKAEPAAISCTTVGDALGGLSIKVKGRQIELTNNGMDDSVTKTLADVTAADLAAFNGGKAVNLIFKSKKSGEFGGAVSNAGLLVLGPKVSGKHTGSYYADRGTVYVLVCSN
ncbi:MAG: hypothetical protein JST92_23925 [Deltaproteobacteria bacterium]|nr:hypothetical protein [Deltaproteobacteria bacterium]